MQEPKLVPVDESPGYGVILGCDEGVVIHSNLLRGREE